MAEKNKKPASSALIAAVKAVAVLVCICLVCVVLLALCNDLLYVSDDLRLARAMSKIYEDYGNGDAEWNKSYVLNSSDTTNTYGTITDVKKAEDGAYVITAKGGGGYKGTITIYLVVKEEGTGSSKDAKIKAWTIKESDGETLLANITDAHRTNWYTNKSIKDFETDSFSIANNKVANTTLTSTAINNAVKAACYYCVNVLELVSTPESEALKAVNALVEGYTFTIVTDSEGFGGFDVGEQKLSFYMEGTKEGADSLEAYVYGTDENRQIVVVKAGLTHSERLTEEVVAKSPNATDEVVNKVKSLSYFEFRIGRYHEGFELSEIKTVEFSYNNKGSVSTVYVSADGALVIQSTGTGGFSSGTVTINVVVAESKIKGWYIVSNKDQSYIGNITSAWNTTSKWYIGSSIEADIALGENKVTGTTLSSTAINNAINTACAYARSNAD